MKTLLWNHYACILGHLFVPGIGSLGLTRLLANANPGCPFICTLYKGGPLLCPPKEVQNLSRPIWEEYIEVLLPLLLGSLLGLDLETHTHTVPRTRDQSIPALTFSFQKAKAKEKSHGLHLPCLNLSPTLPAHELLHSSLVSTLSPSSLSCTVVHA